MRVFDLGELIAERALTFEADAGWSRSVLVKVGRPILDPESQRGAWLCPYQVAGMDRVLAVFGVDAMQALVFAVHTIPAELTALAREHGGRFLHLNALEDSFLAACRSCIEADRQASTQVEESSVAIAPAERVFLNVDLEVESDTSMLTLISALEPYALPLKRPSGRAAFELNEPVSPSTPGLVVREFARLIRSLPPDARKTWDQATKRSLDIGIQGVQGVLTESYRLSIDVLRDAADIDAEIAITVYPVAVQS